MEHFRNWALGIFREYSQHNGLQLSFAKRNFYEKEAFSIRKCKNFRQEERLCWKNSTAFAVLWIVYQSIFKFNIFWAVCTRAHNSIFFVKHSVEITKFYCRHFLQNFRESNYLQGDPNQNFWFQMAVTQSILIQFQKFLDQNWFE